MTSLDTTDPTAMPPADLPAPAGARASKQGELRLGSDVMVLLWHAALYGLAAILQDAGVANLRVWWTRGVRPIGSLSGQGLTPDLVAEVVHAHTARHADASSWISRDFELKGKARGVMSPRLSTIGDDQTTWNALQDARYSVLDYLTDQRAFLDLRLLAALGEPAYWSRNRQGVALQDDGANRLEMQPRNQGSELVRNRLRPLALHVARRDPEAIAAGLMGARLVDEAGGDKADSHTATGLAGLGPTDNAAAWCALWGISQFPIAMRVNPDGGHGPAATSGHLGRSRNEYFYAPVWHQPWRPARLRTILVAEQLATAAARGLGGALTNDDTEDLAAAAWLTGHGVSGLIRFRIERFGSQSAPERRAMRGEPVALKPR